MGVGILDRFPQKIGSRFHFACEAPIVGTLTPFARPRPALTVTPGAVRAAVDKLVHG